MFSESPCVEVRGAAFLLHVLARFRMSVAYLGTVPNLGDLTTDEYSFVIKCPASRHLPVRRKKLLRLVGEVARRAGGVSHPRIIPQGKQKGRYAPPHGEQNGHYGRREGNKKALWPPHGEQNGRYAPVGVRPPPPLRGSSPCKAGQFIPGGFDCRHSEVCKSRNSVLLNSFF